MGLFGGIKSALFGGGGSKGYQSKNIATDENALMQGAFNRAGVTKNRDGTYNYSNVGKSMTVDQANAPYAGAYGSINSLTNKLANPGRIGTDYKPTTFNFGNQDTINKMAENQYGLAAGDLNHQAQGALQQIQTAMGTRRPGLLMKAADENQRNALQNLTQLKTQLNTNAMNQGLQLGKEQQLAQAGENQYLANLKADLAKTNVNNAMSGQQNAIQSYLNTISQKQGVADANRQYADKGLDYLSDLYGKVSGASNAGAQVNSANRGNTMGFLGKVGGSLLSKI